MGTDRAGASGDADADCRGCLYRRAALRHCFRAPSDAGRPPSVDSAVAAAEHAYAAPLNGAAAIRVDIAVTATRK